MALVMWRWVTHTPPVRAWRKGPWTYDIGTNTDYNKCHRHHRGYPDRLSRLDGPVTPWPFHHRYFSEYVSKACSGAKLASIATDSRYNESAQSLDPALGTDNELVTVTIGGNDLEWANYLHQCSTVGGGVCPVSEMYNRLHDPEYASSVRETYSTIKNAVGPNTTVLVMGYPHLFADGATCLKLTALWSPTLLSFFRQLFDDLNSILADAAAEAGVYYASSLTVFDGHEVCGSSGEWINGVTVDST